MTLTEYNAMPEGDLKLAVRTAVTMGWHSDGVEVDANILWVREDWFTEFGMCMPFSPFTDASIPYGLIGRGVDICGAYTDDSGFFAESFRDTGLECEAKTLNHAILNAFCAADPLGHWATFLKDRK